MEVAILLLFINLQPQVIEEIISNKDKIGYKKLI